MRPPKPPAVINRRELPVIIRNPKERRPLLLILAFVAFVAWGFWSGAEPGESVFSRSAFEVEAVQLRPITSKSGVIWQVTGKLVNPTKQTLSAPDLQVSLVRTDDSVAAETLIDLRAQIMPGLSAIPFSARLSTGPGETVSAQVSVQE